jgi:hypothetical protein
VVTVGLPPTRPEPSGAATLDPGWPDPPSAGGEPVKPGGALG